MAPTSIATPTHKPTRCPTANNANDKLKSKPLTAPRSPPKRKYCTTSLANTRVATITANTAALIAPHTTASNPARFSSTPSALESSPPLPTFSTSAHATPSGYGRSEFVTNARRSGIEYITPSTPPSAQSEKEIQYG